MPAKDTFHHAVRNALIKAGWTITHDPFTLEFEDVNFYVDLGAEKVIAAQKEREKVAIEIKSFLRDSIVTELHLASGQYLNYRFALSEIEPDRTLYLAIPNDTYEVFCHSRFVQRILQHHQIKIIVYNPEIEEIVEWQSTTVN
ncbi:hypothetical protein O53_1639 [Microcystis aeruginosa TAIHU98]|uniref:XisH family protein n=1 Tax=Microcystis aeruginosa TAIHU98 TaxID=1134457 RepID=L7EFI1_MICAE|nr:MULTISPECIES: element excision factor XisH family protein [Microcystis]ELP57027.1 hypothetical protein O53_1639 [Microcystis aeruginosa TAIHU98]MCA2626077.1 XisH family protein [Microcystis sp. M19BS1]MCA2633914.1 XisH family protein [Microcystis sp. M20BS1]MDB9393739.1 element excision factor XisH family protein [Microcystis aeruginosa CS-579]ROI09637.1 fatty-acid oxidation protein subunit alpha [Microcystis aeruginosa FACHB-524]